MFLFLSVRFWVQKLRVLSAGRLCRVGCVRLKDRGAVDFKSTTLSVPAKNKKQTFYCVCVVTLAIL